MLESLLIWTYYVGVFAGFFAVLKALSTNIRDPNPYLMFICAVLGAILWPVVAIGSMFWGAFRGAA